MSYSSYEQLLLDDYSTIAGTDFTFTFDIYDENGSPVNLLGKQLSWILYPYGDSNTILLTKAATVTGGDTNTMVVNVTSSDTQNLDKGKYVHEPIIRELDGKIYKPKKGYILIDR